MEKKPKTSAAVKNRYAAKTYDTIRFQARKDLQLPALLDLAVASGKAASRQAYIVEAVLQKLASDGISEES